MTKGDVFKECWVSICGNKIRSILTVLGIVIGVMAVVLMVAAGQTAQNQITGKFSALGTNTMMIRAGAAQNGGIRAGNTNTLTTDDAETIARLPGVMAITPVQTASAQVVWGNKNWSTSMIGVYPDYTAVMNTDIEYGTFFDMSAVRNAQTYAVIGPQTASELDMPQNPVGEIIRIMNVPFTIIGVTRAKGDSAMGSQDDMIIIPVTTLKKRLWGSKFPNSVNVVGIRLYPDADNNIVIDQITNILRIRHRLKEDAPDDFIIMDMKQILETMETITGYMKLLLIAIAAVSLLVGAIGIMNMMLVSVAERTNEIGVRKAIGARSRQIIIQFLSESILLSLIGSLMGMTLGLILAQGVGRLILHYTVPFSLWPLVISVSVALVVGLASGALPAIKAAHLNPIDSLRRE